MGAVVAAGGMVGLKTANYTVMPGVKKTFLNSQMSLIYKLAQSPMFIL